MQVVKRSAQKNGSFQKLFSLPAEEFLINDFACAIERKILIQVKGYAEPCILLMQLLQKISWRISVSRLLDKVTRVPVDVCGMVINVRVIEVSRNVIEINSSIVIMNSLNPCVESCSAVLFCVCIPSCRRFHQKMQTITQRTLNALQRYASLT